MKIYKVLKISFIVLLLTMAERMPVSAQQSIMQSAKMALSIEIEVIDESGNSIPYASINSSLRRKVFTTDKFGRTVLKTPLNDVLKVSANGYASQLVIIDDQVKDKLSTTLVKDVTFNGESNKVLLPFGETTERRSTGSWSKVDGRDLEATPTASFYDAVGGRLTGLFSAQSQAIAGLSAADNWIRAKQGQLIVIIDGVERSPEFLDPELIESVQIVKDATMKSFYQGVESSGIMIIRTRRGKAYENKVSVNLQTGIMQTIGTAKYLDAYDYAMAYNAVCEREGQAPQFTGDLHKYRTGEDPIMYPNNADLYDMFLKKQMEMTRLNMQYTGGNDKTRYFAHLGYQNNGGLEKFTEHPNNDRLFNIRANVDNQVLNYVTIEAGFNAVYQNKSWFAVNQQAFWDSLTTIRPNEYPIKIPGSMVGIPSMEYVLGGTSTSQGNPLGLLTQRGYSDREYNYVQSDIGVSIDLDHFIKGLSFRSKAILDVYNYVVFQRSQSFAVYEPYLDDGEVQFRTYGMDLKLGTVQRVSGADEARRNFMTTIGGDYKRIFGKHDIHAMANFALQKREAVSMSTPYDMKRLNMGVMLNYMYNNRYIAEICMNRVGVPTFAPDKRFGTFPAFGAGWVLSDETFMRNITWLDYLKLRASWGILGSAGTYEGTDMLLVDLDRNVWNGTITAYPNMGDTESAYYLNVNNQGRAGNPNLTFQKTYETNAGVDMLLFKKLRISGGYFHNRISGLFSQANNVISGIVGLNTAEMSMQNFREVTTWGAEGEASYSNTIGDFRYNIGANFAWGKGKVTKENELIYPEGLATQLPSVKELGAIRGYTCIGVYQSQEELDNHLSNTANIMVGDLKYKDYDGNQIINAEDQTIIGNSIPSLSYGITLKLRWKGFNVDMLGYGLGGFQRLLNNRYYQIYGTRKYSNVLNTGLPNGNPHPQVPLTDRLQNFQTSSYWIVDGSWFKLRNVEIGYTMPNYLTEKAGLTAVKFFTRGFNLLSLSKFKEFDPEDIDAGVSKYPLFRTMTVGITVTF